MRNETAPGDGLALEIVTNAIGQAPVNIQRFTTGARHYVYDVEFANHPPVVLRIGDRSAHAEMAGAVHLSNLLRPRGVPLTAILTEDVAAEFPWLILERLPGTDLGTVIANLSDEQ